MPQEFTVELRFATLQKALEVAKAFDGFADDVSIDLGIEEAAFCDCGSPREEKKEAL